MLQRLPYKEAPAQLREIIDKLQENGDCLVVEDEQRQPIACVTLLPYADKVHRAEGVRELRTILAQVPTSPYSEEETFRLIEDAIVAIRQEDPKQAVS